jgi:hypothetical protein
LTFVPFALGFGVVSDRAGVDQAGWLLAAIGLAAGLLMVDVLPRAPVPIAQATFPPTPTPAMEPAFPSERFLPPDDPQWPGHWAHPPATWDSAGVGVHNAASLEHARAAIAELPAALRQVIVLHDVQGRAPEEVRRVLNLSPDQERAMVHQARGLVRARLEDFFQRTGSSDAR